MDTEFCIQDTFCVYSILCFSLYKNSFHSAIMYDVRTFEENKCLRSKHYMQRGVFHYDDYGSIEPRRQDFT